MNKIKVLSFDQAQKVAAGEVVERPANIVKELIENSIDAGATQISVYVEKAGKALLRIVDNGCGMSPEDAKLCFLPHATSKISTLHDLEKIQTFGFRGEALASIAAVSKVTLITKYRESFDDQLGIRLDYSDSRCIAESSVVCPVGTDITVKDLFHTIPARKNFLKQDATEWNQIQDIFYAFCLSRRNIHFKLFHENKPILNAPAVKNLKDRITQLWDHNFSQNLIALHEETSPGAYGSFEGLISNHQFWRYGRDAIYFFVNNRWVKNTELSKALLKGYLNVLPPGKFPAAFIFISIDQHCVDVNVHPKKEEVRFTKPGVIETSIQNLVKLSLERHVTRQLQPKQQEQAVPDLSEQLPPLSTVLPDFLPSFFPVDSVAQPTFKPLSKPPIFTTFKLEKSLSTQQASLFNHQQKEQMFEKARVIGQLFETYILLEHDSDLVMIDQHAAHERILYEEFLKNFEKKDGVMLMFPELITFSSEQITLIMQEKEFFQNQGVVFDVMGDNTLAIKSAPPKIQHQSLKELLYDAASFIRENETLEHDLFRKKLNEHVHSHMACKAAVKAGDVLTMQQMQQLVTDLAKTEKRFICVHGRPTLWTLSQDSIEKNFRRK